MFYNQPNSRAKYKITQALREWSVCERAGLRNVAMSLQCLKRRAEEQHMCEPHTARASLFVALSLFCRVSTGLKDSPGALCLWIIAHKFLWDGVTLLFISDYQTKAERGLILGEYHWEVSVKLHFWLEWPVGCSDNTKGKEQRWTGSLCANGSFRNKARTALILVSDLMMT